MKDFFSFPLWVQAIGLLVIALWLKIIAVIINMGFKQFMEAESMLITDEEALQIEAAHARYEAEKALKKELQNNEFQID